MKLVNSVESLIKTVLGKKLQTKSKTSLPVYRFSVCNTNILYSGSEEILKFLTETAKDYSVSESKEETPLKDISKFDKFEMILTDGQNIDSFAKRLYALGDSAINAVYFLTVSAKAYFNKDHKLIYEDTGILTDKHFEPVVCIWSVKDSIWIKSIFQDYGLPVFASGIGQVTMEETKSPKEKTTSVPVTIEGQRIEKAILEICEFCFEIVSVSENEESEKESVSKKLEQFAADDEDNKFNGYKP